MVKRFLTQCAARRTLDQSLLGSQAVYRSQAAGQGICLGELAASSSGRARRNSTRCLQNRVHHCVRSMVVSETGAIIASNELCGRLLAQPGICCGWCESLIIARSGSPRGPTCATDMDSSWQGIFFGIMFRNWVLTRWGRLKWHDHNNCEESSRITSI